MTEDLVTEGQASGVLSGLKFAGHAALARKAAKHRKQRDMRLKAAVQARGAAARAYERLRAVQDARRLVFQSASEVPSEAYAPFEETMHSLDLLMFEAHKEYLRLDPVGEVRRLAVDAEQNKVLYLVP